MAEYIIIRADANHEYRISMEVAGHVFQAVVDTGFVDPRCQAGIGLDNQSYLSVQNMLQQTFAGDMYLVGGRETTVPVESGLAEVSIVGLDGSQVQRRVVNAGENLLGVCYFHQLVGFEVVWDLAQREMMIRRRG